MSRIPYLRDESKFSNHGCYDPMAVTKLINNYRSHEALLELPSRLFYHAEMVPCADVNIKNCLCEWNTLPNKNGFPLLFYGVKVIISGSENILIYIVTDNRLFIYQTHILSITIHFDRNESDKKFILLERRFDVIKVRYNLSVHNYEFIAQYNITYTIVMK